MKNPRYTHYELLECWKCGRVLAFYDEHRRDNEKKEKHYGMLHCPSCFANKMTEEEKYKLEHMQYKPWEPEEEPTKKKPEKELSNAA